MNKKNNLLKKTIAFLLVIIMSFSMTGCWDYIGLNQITIVAGLTIDWNDETQKYEMTFETIDLSKPIKEKGLLRKVITAEGKTLIDTGENTSKIPLNRFIYANTPIIVISKEIAEKGLRNIINLLAKDDEMRETLQLIISEEDKASEILTLDEKNEMVLSYKIYSTILNSQLIRGDSINTPLFQAFNALNGEGESLVLPNVSVQENNGILTPVIEGISLFDNDKLIGSLSADETINYNIIKNSFQLGVMNYNLNETPEYDVALEVTKSNTELSYSYENNKFKVKIKNEIHTIIGDMNLEIDVLDKKQMDELIKKCEQINKERIEKLLEKAQKEYKTDIFGFGNLVYRKDPKLWKELKPEWNNIFENMEFEVDTKINIVNTNHTKE